MVAISFTLRYSTARHRYRARSTLYAELPFPELRSCVKVEVAVLGSPSLVVLMVSVDVKQH